MRQHQPDHFAPFHKDLLAAHFVRGEDLGSSDVVDRYATDLGIDLQALQVALADGSTLTAVKEADALGRRNGAQGTPAWLLAQRLISGLLPALDFERLAEAAEQRER